MEIILYFMRSKKRWNCVVIMIIAATAATAYRKNRAREREREKEMRIKFNKSEFKSKQTNAITTKRTCALNKCARLVPTDV